MLVMRKRGEKVLNIWFPRAIFLYNKTVVFPISKPNSQELLFYLTGELTKQKMPNVENLR